MAQITVDRAQSDQFEGRPHRDHADERQLPARARRGVSAIRRDDFDRDVWCLLGLPVDIADLQGAVAEVESAVRDRRRLSFVTPNVNWLVRALADSGARRQVIDADLSLVDGAPLAAFARALGIPIRQRTAGSDLFEALRRRPGFQGRRMKVFFFGGRDGAAEQSSNAVNAERGGVESVGWHNPGFGDVEAMSTPEILAKINAAAPDFVVVALGAAKGQAWIEHNQDRLDAPALAHLGAVVDFTAGSVVRAPAVFQKLGMEWAWRIKEEPALWRRYFDDALALARIAATRLAPQLVRAGAKTPEAGAGAVVTAEGGAAVIKLSGSLTRNNLKPVCEAFRAAAGRGAGVVMDFSAATDMDLAFLGQVLMLEKHTTRQGQALTVTGLSSRQKSLLRANAMNYPETELRLKDNSAIEISRRAAI